MIMIRSSFNKKPSRYSCGAATCASVVLKELATNIHRDLASRDMQKSGAACASDWNVMSPDLELIDPTPDLWQTFNTFNENFFNSALVSVSVSWSSRMTLCAGTCSYRPRTGECTIRLSKPLLSLRPRHDFINTLLHEMIHAFLFVKRSNRDHDDHGPSFQAQMRRLNSTIGSKITIYHSFKDEVENYRTHWWRCQGKVCPSKPPFFGIVKRSMNRAPGPSDPWYAAHKASCGGTFIKIKEPEGYKQKKKSLGKRKKPPEERDGIKSFFPKKKAPPEVIDLCDSE